ALSSEGEGGRFFPLSRRGTSLILSPSPSEERAGVRGVSTPMAPIAEAVRVREIAGRLPAVQRAGRRLARPGAGDRPHSLRDPGQGARITGEGRGPVRSLPRTRPRDHSGPG